MQTIKQNLFDRASLQVEIFVKYNGQKVVPIDVLKYIDVNRETFYNIDVIEMKQELIENVLYLLYCKETGKHYWSTLFKIGDGSCKLMVFMELLFDESNNFIRHKRIELFCIKRNNFDNYVIYGTSFMGTLINLKYEVPQKYNFIRFKKYWNDYCNELIEDEDNKSKVYFPIKKISHIREITDLIESFI
jgi:hypothetical protein